MSPKESAPTWVALAVLAAIGAGLWARSRGGGDRGPEATVYAMFEAVGKGDVAGYLDCYGGELLDRLKAAARESGDARFAEDLRRRGEGMTGIAISRPPGDAASSAESAILRVEQVFRDRNEAQDYSLRRRRGRWRIEGIGPANTVKMPIPYGTPVYAPESATNVMSAGGTGQRVP